MNNYYQVEQKDYQFGFSVRFTPVVKILLIVNIAAFLLRLVLKNYFAFDALFGFMPVAVMRDLFIWQPCTYFLFHANVWHLLVNLLIIWMFGADVEQALGPRRFCALYAALPVIAAAAAICIAPTSAVLFLGPSAAVFGILTAFGVLFPERVVTLLLLFLIPVSVKAKYLAAGFIMFELLVLLDAPTVAVVNFAPLVAVPLCIIWLRRRSRAGIFRPGGGRVHTRRAPLGETKEYFMEREIDPILDKISREGLHALTKGEREKLEKARSKIKKT